jgi:uncharacterized protein (DUF2267 family)
VAGHATGGPPSLTQETPMTYEQFVAAVQDSLGTGRDAAERATRATLRTLADRLSVAQARRLVMFLPDELGPLMFHAGPPERLDIDAFLNRVAARENVGVATARRHAALVLSVIARAVGPDVLDDIAATLPKDFAPLLPRGPDIEVRPARALEIDVARRCGVDAVEARRAIDAVLQTLAESIAPGEIDDLIARLPIELHPVLKAARARNPGHASPTSLETFTRRVAQRAGTDPEHAAEIARAVLSTLREAVGDEEFFDITVQLPPEFGALWVTTPS